MTRPVDTKLVRLTGVVTLAAMPPVAVEVYTGPAAEVGPRWALRNTVAEGAVVVLGAGAIADAAVFGIVLKRDALVAADLGSFRTEIGTLSRFAGPAGRAGIGAPTTVFRIGFQVHTMVGASGELLSAPYPYDALRAPGQGSPRDNEHQRK